MIQYTLEHARQLSAVLLAPGPYYAATVLVTTGVIFISSRLRGLSYVRRATKAAAYSAGLTSVATVLLASFLNPQIAFTGTLSAIGAIIPGLLLAPHLGFGLASGILRYISPAQSRALETLSIVFLVTSLSLSIFLGQLTDL